jgi:hypothetical protein
MPLPVIIAGAITWCGGIWTVAQPLIPGIIAIGSWMFGSHFLAFGGSWLSARWYSKNCIGEGLSGMFQSYWKMGSPMCTSLLVSHVALLAVAVASVVCTAIIFLWLWYSTFKKLLWPIKQEITDELHSIKAVHQSTKIKNILITKEEEEEEESTTI